MPISKCVVLGAGGHAAVVIESIGIAKCAQVIGCLDANEALWGKTVLNIPILGGDALLRELKKNGVRMFAMGVGAVGNNQLRAKLFEKACAAGLHPLTVVHPSAVVSPSAVIADGCFIAPVAVIHTRAQIGKNVIVNTCAIVEHDCVIGDHAHVATGATLTSGVVVEAYSHIGAGAVVRQTLSIGRSAVVGAGAVVITDVPAGQTYIGVPAKAKRSLEAKQAEGV